MELRKKIIALLLIFAYSIGFAHDLVPHFHTEFEVQKVNVHANASMGGNSHQHVEVQADNEFNLLDLLICLFESIDHDANESNDALVTSINEISVAQLNVIIPTQNWFSIEYNENIDADEEKFSVLDFSPNKIQPRFLKSHSHRGPPSFYC